jgi:hypothetical protein
MATTPDDTQAATSCWIDAETAITRCFETDAAVAASILAVTGAVPAELVPDLRLTQSRSSLVALSSAILARLYENTSWGGDAIIVVGPSSDWCDSNSVTDNDVGSAWNDRISSVRVYNGCSVRLYTNTNLGGTSAAFGTASSIGSMNNETSSYRVY